MQNALQGLLQALANIVSGLSPVAKAVVAAVLPLAASLLNMALAGSFNTASIIVLATGAITSLAVYLVANRPKVQPAPPAPAKAKRASK